MWLMLESSPESSPIQALKLGFGNWSGGCWFPTLSGRTVRGGTASRQGYTETDQITAGREDWLDPSFLHVVHKQDSCFGAGQSQDS